MLYTLQCLNHTLESINRMAELEDHEDLHTCTSCFLCHNDLNVGLKI